MIPTTTSFGRFRAPTPVSYTHLYSVISGALPTGLTLNAATGAVAGTITAAGTFNFTIRAADIYGDSGTHTYQIVVVAPTLIVTPGEGALSLAITGQAYSQTLTVSGGTGIGYTWVVSGLSNGLTSLALSLIHI